MDLKGRLYDVAMLAWGGLAFGTWILTDLGYTEPWLSFSAVPGGSNGAFAIALGVSLVGWYVIGTFKGRHKRDEWREMGRQVGLRPADDPGDRIVPELTGTVDGRTVTASYDIERVSSGDEGGSSSITYTFGGAELAGPADEGVLVGSAGERFPTSGTGTLEFDDMAETAADMDGLVGHETGDLVLVGTSEAAVEAVAGGVSGRALDAFADLEIASIGDAPGAVTRWVEARNEQLEEEGSPVEYPVETLVERLPGDASTVTVEMQSSLRNADDLQRFTEGVVAIADAFEEATARAPAAE